MSSSTISRYTFSVHDPESGTDVIEAQEVPETSFLQGLDWDLVETHTRKTTATCDERRIYQACSLIECDGQVWIVTFTRHDDINPDD